MTDMLDLLGEVSPSLKAGWVLWCSSGVALVWFGLVRATRVTAAPPPAAVARVAPSLSLQKEPWSASGTRLVTPEPIAAVSEPSLREPDAPAKKPRRRERQPQ